MSRRSTPGRRASSSPSATIPSPIPTGLVAYVAEQASFAKVRPDMKIVFIRDVETPDERLKARDDDPARPRAHRGEEGGLMVEAWALIDEGRVVESARFPEGRTLVELYQDRSCRGGAGARARRAARFGRCRFRASPTPCATCCSIGPG